MVHSEIPSSGKMLVILFVFLIIVGDDAKPFIWIAKELNSVSVHKKEINR